MTKPRTPSDLRKERQPLGKQVVVSGDGSLGGKVPHFFSQATGAQAPPPTDVTPTLSASTSRGSLPERRSRRDDVGRRRQGKVKGREALHHVTLLHFIFVLAVILTLGSSANGGFVAVWEDNSVRIDYDDIAARGLRTNAQERFPQMTVNTLPVGYHKRPAIAMDEYGNFVVVWQTPASGDLQVRARGFYADGSQRFPEMPVSVSAVGGLNQNPDIAMNGNGDFVVVWDGGEIKARGFHADGTQRFPQTTINASPDGWHSSPAIAMDENGNFVVVWAHDYNKDGLYEIKRRGFYADGSERFPQMIVNTLPLQHLSPDIDMNDNGDFVVVWQYDVANTGQFDIRARGFHANGSQRFAAITVNPILQGRQIQPAIAMGQDGNFAVVWEDDANQDFLYEIMARGFYANGTLRFPQKAVSSSSFYPHNRYPDIDMDDNGDFVVVWDSDFLNTGVWNIRARGFHADGSPRPEMIVNSDPCGDEGMPRVAVFDPPSVTVTARDATAAETGPDPGVFRISRTGDTDPDLRVYFAMKGTATNSQDYPLIRTNFPRTIPAGASYADVTVTPIDDSVYEGDETVILEIVDNAAYEIGSPNTATVTIQDNDPAPDAAPPTVDAFDVSPTFVTVGNAVTITYTVADTGGSGLNEVELSRRLDGDDTWQKIASRAHSGNGPVSDFFTDTPSQSGDYWYGFRVSDNVGNWNDERNSQTGNLPGDFGPILVEVTPQTVFDFANDSQAWTWFDYAGIFVQPGHGWNAGALEMSETATDQIVYGTWESPKNPAVAVRPAMGRVFRAKYHMRSSVSGAACPGFRFRAVAAHAIEQTPGVWRHDFANSDFNSHVELFCSTLDFFHIAGREPGPTGQTYTHLYYPEQVSMLNDPGVVVYFTCDLCDIDTLDRDAGTIYIDRVDIDSFERPAEGTGRACPNLTFSDFSSWTSHAMPINSQYDGTDLSVSCSADNISIHILPGNQWFEAYAFSPSVTLTPGKYYRAIFRVTGSAYQIDDLPPTIRAGFASSKFVFSSSKDLYGGADEAGYDATQQTPFEVWLVAPTEDPATPGRTEPIRLRFESWLADSNSGWPFYRVVSGALECWQVDTERFEPF